MKNIFLRKCYVDKKINFAHKKNRLGLRLVSKNGELAQLARALAWHARGRRFDSDILHIYFIGILFLFQFDSGDN